MNNNRTVLTMIKDDQIMIDAVEGKESVLHSLYPELTVEERIVSDDFYQEIVDSGGTIKY